MIKIKQTITALLFMAVSFVGFSQTYEGDLILSSQAEVDAFNYTEVTGRLVITKIQNLNGLSSLTSVGGEFLIHSNETLTNLDGLSNLTSVGCNLYIRDNRILDNLNGLSNVTSVGNSLYIGNNDSLTDLVGLQNITSVEKHLFISENDNLLNLCAISQLITNGQIDETEYDTYNNGYNPSYIEIQSNTSCSIDNINSGNGIYKGNLRLETQAEVDAFNYTEVTGYLKIGNITDRHLVCGNNAISSGSSDKISNLNNLVSLTTIGGYLQILYNSNLYSLAGLENLTTIGGYLSILNNSNLYSLAGLENLTILKGNLFIGSTTSVSPPPGSVEELFETLFYGNKNLSNLCGIQQLITNGQITSDEYIARLNRYNPTYEQIQTNCEYIPLPSLTLTKQDFGNVALGSQITKNIAIKNTGESTLTIATITKTDTTGNFVLLGNDSDVSLEPNETFNFLVRLNANSLGTKEMTLHIDSNASDVIENFIINGTVVSPTNLETTTPNAPTATVVDDKSIQVTWQTDADALSYRLYRNTSFGTKEQIYWGSVTSYFDTELTAETTYTYSLAEENAGGLSLVSNEVSATTLETEVGVSTPKADILPVLLNPYINTNTKWVEGKEFDIDIAIHNKGNEASIGVYGRLSLSKIDNNGGNDYILLDSIPIHAIEPSKTEYKTVGVKVPNVSAGDYHLVFNVDAFNQQNDANSRNNVKVSNEVFTIYPENPSIKPELVSRFLDVPKTMVKGVESEMEISISNVGNDYSEEFKGQLYLSKDRYFSEDDILLGVKNNHEAIDEDIHRKEIITYTIPTTVETGNYYFVYEIDTENEIEELYEQNNFVSSSEKIEVLTNGTVEINGRIRTVNSLYNEDEGLFGIRIAGLPGIVTTGSDGNYSASVPVGWSGELTITNPLYLVAPVIENSQIVENAQSDKTIDFIAADPVVLFSDVSEVTQLLPDHLKGILGNDFLSNVGGSLNDNIPAVFGAINKIDDVYKILRSDQDDIDTHFNTAKLLTGAAGGKLAVVSGPYIYLVQEFYAEVDRIMGNLSTWYLENKPDDVFFNIRIVSKNYHLFNTYVNPNKYISHLQVKMLAYEKDENGKNKIISTRILTKKNPTIGNSLNSLSISGGNFSYIYAAPASYSFTEETKFFVELNWLNNNREIAQRMLLPLDEPFVNRLSGTPNKYIIEFEIDKGKDIDFNSGAHFLKLKK